MPTVFLSYSREDFSLIEQLEAKLKSHPEISIWRDQEKIYGGQKWPKVLGEAIADQDVFLLVWSKHSATSHFVEFEWCTAIALKKTIVPCLLDETPLASSLRTFQGYRPDDVTGLITSLRGAPPGEVQRRGPVIHKLSDITATDETAVLAQVKTVFVQQQWTVQGNVYQAGGDIHIHNEPSTPSVPAKVKPLAERWQAWVVIIGGILAAVLTALQIKERVLPTETQEKSSPISTEDKAAGSIDQPLAGTIFDEYNKRLSGVLVKLPEFKKSFVTDQDGRFEFSVKAPQGQQVELVAEKSEYEPMERFVSLGNEHDDFTMKRTRR